MQAITAPFYTWARYKHFLQLNRVTLEGCSQGLRQVLHLQLSELKPNTNTICVNNRKKIIGFIQLTLSLWEKKSGAEVMMSPQPQFDTIVSLTLSLSCFLFRRPWNWWLITETSGFPRKFYFIFTTTFTQKKQFYDTRRMTNNSEQCERTLTVAKLKKNFVYYSVLCILPKQHPTQVGLRLLFLITCHADLLSEPKFRNCSKKQGVGQIREGFHTLLPFFFSRFWSGGSDAG